MAYARRSTYRRKGRRGNRTLSTRRIFGNKSAKSQAKQINALKKSINRVYRQCKPEYKLVRTGTENRGFGYDSSTSGSPALVNSVIAPIIMPQSGTGDNQRVGNKITISPVTFFLNSQYIHRNQIVGNLYPYSQNPLQSTGLVLRFVAIQSMVPLSATPTMAEIFESDYTATNTLSQDLMMMMTMPFKNGITARFKILKDKRYFINEDKPIFAKRIKVKPAIKSLRWEDGSNYPRGTVFYIMIAAGGEITYADDQTTEKRYYNYNSLDTTWRHEYAYTDA
nr:MAG: capsid protein [Virus sp.]